jgi:hypothetical protein
LSFTVENPLGCSHMNTATQMTMIATVTIGNRSVGMLSLSGNTRARAGADRRG